MEILKAIILGIVEGITEFLPISSTGHILVAEDVLNYRDDASVFTVVIQLGAIMAAAWYFRHDLLYIIRSLRSGDRFMRTFVVNVFLGLLPAFVIGLLVELTVGLPDSLTLIASTLIVGGLTILYIESLPHRKASKHGDVQYEDITKKRSIIIGFGQCLSLIPGVSRSGATIMTGLLAGLDRKTATVFSFYLSIPIMFGASAVKLISNRSALSNVEGGLMALLVGTAVACITAFLVIKWLLKYVQTHDFKPFAYYRIALGLALLLYLQL